MAWRSNTLTRSTCRKYAQTCRASHSDSRLIQTRGLCIGKHGAKVVSITELQPHARSGRGGRNFRICSVHMPTYGRRHARCTTAINQPGQAFQETLTQHNSALHYLSCDRAKLKVLARHSWCSPLRGLVTARHRAYTRCFHSKITQTCNTRTALRNQYLQ